MQPEIIIGQAFGILATIFCLISYQMNTKKSILIIQTFGTLCTCFSYFFLGATSGFVLNLACIIRNIVFYFVQDKKSIPFSILFAVIIGILGGLSWQGYISLLIIIPLAVNTICLSLGKPQLLRFSILFTSTTIIVYNIFVFSIGGIINETLIIISAIIGILRFHTKKDDPTTETNEDYMN